MTTHILKISGMHCTSCALNIDMELEDAVGVKEASTNYAREETKIVFDEQIISAESITQIINKVGYTVICHGSPGRSSLQDKPCGHLPGGLLS